MEWIASTITAVIKEGWKLYLAAFIASVALLFLPDSTIVKLGLDDFRHSHRMEAGVVLIGSASLLATHFIAIFVNMILSPFFEWRFNRMIYKTLTELTYEEKEFLIPFIVRGRNTLYADLYDGIAKGLEAKKILYCSSQVSGPGGAFPYNMQPYARKILTKHSELLKI